MNSTALKSPIRTLVLKDAIDIIGIVSCTILLLPHKSPSLLCPCAVETSTFLIEYKIELGALSKCCTS